MRLADRLRAIVDPLPAGASVTLPADTVRAWLDDEPSAPAAPELVTDAAPQSWRERLWAVPAEMRLGVLEVAEAVGRSRDWVYRACSAEQAKAKGRSPLPCSRLDGELVFTAGAVRDWITRNELVVNPAPSAVWRAA